MSDIPDDIRKTAERIWREYHSTRLAPYDLPLEISNAILAERSGARTAALQVLKDVYRWADGRCPCHNDEPNPCPLCGASIENLQACKSVESIFPPEVLRDVRAAIRVLEA